MKKLSTLVCIAVLAFGATVSGQQLPQFTQYMYNTISVNPAYAGSRGTLNVTALHRNQWAGIESNPQTSTLSIHAPMRNERVGLGLSYINDKLGDEQTNYIYGDFSYTIPITYEGKLSFGLKAGFTNYSLTPRDPSDPFFNNTSLNQWSPNFGAGLYYSTNSWYIGVSSPRILNTDLNDGEFEALERNSYYAIAGLVFDVSENVKFKPTFLTKFTNGAPVTYDVTANFLFSEKLWLGASYRFNDASNFGALLDFQATKDFRVGYGYDIPTGDIKPYSKGTHEIILIFELRSRYKGGIKSPRYF